MIVPYSTEVVITKWPVSNLVIMATCALLFVVLVTGGLPDSALESMVLFGWNPLGLIGHQFLHADLWHLLFNMLYLWVFGNAVCEKVGSPVYALLFLTTGVSAGALHNLVSGQPAVGASGAINGIIAFYLVLYPVNRINCFYWFFRPGTFDITGFWLILLWFLADAYGACFGGEGHIAYWAHLGGFASGFVLGVVFLKTGLARMADFDNPTLLDYLQGKHKARQTLAEERKSFRRSSTTALSSVPPPRPRPAPAVTPADINVDCPHCGQNLDLPPEMLGAVFTCPACHGEIRIEAG